MGFIPTICGDLPTTTSSSHSNNKIYSSSPPSSKKFQIPPESTFTSPSNQILAVVRPIGRFCRAFGVFPFSFITLGDTVYLRTNPYCSIFFCWSLFILLITTGYMIFQAVSFILCIPTRPILRLLAQSIWFISAVPPYLVTVFMMVQGRAVVGLFEEWASIERDLERLFCPIMTKRQVHRFLRIYFLISLVSIGLCGYHVICREKAPVYPFYYLETYPEWWHSVYVIFQVAMIVWIWAGLIILEGICCLFATVIGQCMTTLVMGLEFTFNKGKVENTEGNEENVYTNPLPDHKIKNHDEFMRTAVHSILMRGAVPSSGDHQLMDENNKCSFKTFSGSDDLQHPSKIHKEDYLIFVVRKLQTVALLQTRVNRILGPLLLVNVAQLVILSCTMFFLPLRYAHKLDGFEVVVTFLGNGVAILVRLVLFVVSLGSVYTKGQDVNIALARAMISSKMGASCQNPVLAYLSVFSSNPITFTAWDFFPITRGTLLAAFSVISTYAIVFLQINF